MVKNVPWCAKPNVKSLNSGNALMTMMTTFVIALYNKQSPLHKYMDQNNSTLGQPWTVKHGQ
jgi:hypothetical protein